MHTVSIITPTSADPRREGYWEALATSVNCQTNVDVEWLVAAPRGRDTVHMLNRLEAAITSPTVALSHVPVTDSSTVGARRNSALRKATGAYTINLDDDDILAGADSISARIDAAGRSGALWSLGQFRDYHGDHAEAWGRQLSAGTYRLPDQISLLLPDDVPALAHTGAILAETDLLHHAGGWHPTLPAAEDLDLLYRLCWTTSSVAVAPETVLLYRKHPASIMANVDRTEDRRVIAELRAKYGLPPLFE